MTKAMPRLNKRLFISLRPQDRAFSWARRHWRVCHAAKAKYLKHYPRSSFHMMCFAMRRLLFCHISVTIFLSNTFNLSFFMVEVLLRSLACNGVLITNYNEWWVIAVVFIKVFQCAIG